MTEKKSLAYILVIDKDRTDVLTVMASSTMKQLPQILKAHPDFPVKALSNLLKELGVKTHERGWCLDPDCKQQ